MIHTVSAGSQQATTEQEEKAVAIEEEEEEEEDEYEYEDDEDAAFTSSFLVDHSLPAPSSTVEPQDTKTWREPSRAAVDMSLRAESEKTGGKRRLASDLYRIMNQDTQEAGFSLEPSSEDCMDKWKIKLFQFDEDSNLAKDMVAVGVDHIELEMSFVRSFSIPLDSFPLKIVSHSLFAAQ